MEGYRIDIPQLAIIRCTSRTAASKAIFEAQRIPQAIYKDPSRFEGMPSIRSHHNQDAQPRPLLVLYSIKQGCVLQRCQEGEGRYYR